MTIEELEARFNGMHGNTVQYLADLHSEPEQWQYGLRESEA
jgi:hypothetical protein